MAYIIEQTGVSYANFAAAWNAIPTTLDKNYTILSDASETSSSAAFTLSGKTTGSYYITIDFQDKTRELYNSSTSASYVLNISTSNVRFKNVTFRAVNYTNTSQRSVYFSALVNNISFENCVFNGGYRAIGHYSIAANTQLNGLTFSKCTFKNFVAGSIYVGTQTFTGTAWQTATDTQYQFKNVSITKCNFVDENNKAVIPTTTSYTNNIVNLRSCYNITFSDNTFDTTREHGFICDYSYNLECKRNYIKDFNWSNQSTRYGIGLTYVKGITIASNLLVSTATGYALANLTSTMNIKVNNNTFVSSGTVLGLDIQTSTQLLEHYNNIYFGTFRFQNTTAGITNTEIIGSNNNIYFASTATTNATFQFGTTIYACRNASYTDTVNWKALGYDANSYFVASASTTAEKSEIFNKNTNVNRPYYAALQNSIAYRTGNSVYSESVDLRGFNKRTPYDIGAYDYDALDPNVTYTPPVISITKNRNEGIKNDTTYQFNCSYTLQSGASISSIVWDFGDTTTSNLQNPSKQYTSSGTKTVTCTVSDSNDMSSTETLTVTVYDEGVEVIGGLSSYKVFTGSFALQQAITGAYAGNPLSQDVTIKVKTTVNQDYIYYTGKENGRYRLTIEGDLTLTNGVRPKVIPSVAQNGIWFQTGGNVTMKNIELQGYADSTSALNIGGLKNMRFENCIFGNGQQAVIIGGADGIDFVNCTIRNGKYYRLSMSQCKNITFKGCQFTGTFAPYNEFSLSPSVSMSIYDCFNIKFHKCSFSGVGNWETMLKGNNLYEISFICCYFEKWLGRLFWLTGGTRENYNCERWKIYNCVFNVSNLANANALFPSDFSVGKVNYPVWFELDCCFDFEFYNNTFIANRAGVAGYTMSIFLGTYNTNNFKIRNNIFVLKSAIAVTATGIMQVYGFDKNALGNGYDAVYSSDNVFVFEETSTSTMRVGRMNGTYYSTVAQAKTAKPTLYEVNSVEVTRGNNTILNETTFKLNSNTNPLPSAATNRTNYDYNVGVRTLNIGAVEYDYSAYNPTNIVFRIINKNKAVALTYYESSSTQVSIPSVEYVNLYIDEQDSCLLNQVEMSLKDSAGEVYYSFSSGFYYQFPFTEMPKLYSLTISATYDNGSTSILDKPNYFNIIKARPIVDFSLDNYQIFKGEKFSLSHESYYGETFSWTIKNSTDVTVITSTLPSPTGLSLDTTDDYSITLEVTNSTGSASKTYKKTLQVLDYTSIPFLRIEKIKHTYFKRDKITLVSTLKFRKPYYRVVWHIYNSEDTSQAPVLVVEGQNAIIKPESLPQGEYDVIAFCMSPTGTTMQFKRRWLIIINNPTQELTINCSLSDTYQYVVGSNSYTRLGTKIAGVQPGTLIKLKGSTRRLYFEDCTGTEAHPIVVVPDNSGDKFLVYGDYSASSETLITCVEFKRSVFMRFAGDMNVHSSVDYGFDIQGVSEQATFAVRAMNFSNEIRISGSECHGTAFAGIQMKTEPDPNNNKTWRGSFKMNRTMIYDSYIHDVDGEGMYLGFTLWSSATAYYTLTEGAVDENGFPVTKFFAHLMENTKVFRNKTKNTGWDAIQVGNSTLNCEIHDNQTVNSGYQGVFGQSSSLSINSGSDAIIYNNKLDKNMIPQPYKRFWMFNNNMTGIYIITDNNDFWDDTLPSDPTKPYFGQYWDGKQTYDNEYLDIRIFGNSILCSGDPIVHNNKVTTKSSTGVAGVPKVFTVVNNLIVCSDISFSQIDPAQTANNPANTRDIQLMTIFNNYYAQGDMSHYRFSNNAISKLSVATTNYKIANVEKNAFNIRPDSLLIFGSDSSAFISQIAPSFWRGYLFDIEGYCRIKKGAKLVTVGAYHFPREASSDLFVELYGGFPEFAESAMSSVAKEREFFYDSKFLVFNRYKKSFMPLSNNDINGTFEADGKKFIVQHGLIVQVIEK